MSNRVSELQHKWCFKEVLDPPTCLSCQEGHLVRKRGKYGEFFGCCAYPRCKATYKTSTVNQMYDPPDDFDFAKWEDQF